MIKKEFFVALEDLEKEKGIPQQTFIEALENALVFAYKKHTGESSGITVKLNPEKKTVRFFSTKQVVDEVTDEEKQISLEDAQEIKKSYKVGDVIENEIEPKDFGRIAAQTAKQVVMQKLREIERQNAMNEFEDKEGELLTCVVRRIEDKSVYVDIGSTVSNNGSQIEGVLMPNDQIPGEKYELNQKIKVYVKKVRNAGRSAQIVVSRTAPGFVKSLFENEVPEIKQGVVSVKAVAKIPWWTRWAPASAQRARASTPLWKNSAAKRSTSFPGAQIRWNSSRKRFRPPRSSKLWNSTGKTPRAQSFPTTSFRLPSAGTDRTPASPCG